MPATRHTCPIQGCGKTCARRKDVERHLDTHNALTKNRWACPFEGCGRTARQKSNLTTHIRQVHDITIPPTRRLPAPKATKVPSQLARSVENDRVDSIAAVQAQLGVFSLAEVHGTCDAPYKVEEQEWNGYLSNNASTHSLDSVPSLSPSTSSDSSSPLSWPSTPSPAFDYNVAAAPIATPSFDYCAIPQPLPAPSLNFSFMCPQMISGPSFDLHVACADLKPTTSFQRNASALQYWNNPPATLIPAYGLPDPLVNSQPEPQQVPGFDLSFGAPSTYPLNELGCGILFPEYEPAIRFPLVYPTTVDDLNCDDLFVQSVNLSNYSAFDPNYFDASWGVAASMDNLTALNYF